MKYNLPFIKDEDLFSQVLDTIGCYSFSINLDKFNKNIIDPIKLTFDSHVYEKKIDSVIELEVLRQLDKTNSNALGYFHQNIFRHLGGSSWEVPKTGFDVQSIEDKIFVEMKNKHNTMNSSSAQKTYIKLQSKALEDIEATCYLVEVIAKKSQDIPWETMVDGEKKSNERIRRISIDKFYALVTGHDTAFAELCKVLPEAISDVVNHLKSTGKTNSQHNTVLQELKDISPNILKSLYLKSFSTYEGFRDFDI